MLQSGMDYLNSRLMFGMVPGLESTRKLCEVLGNPQNKFKTIHVVGTNGKGSGKKDLYYYAMIKFQPSVKMTANNVGVSRGDNKKGNEWRDSLAGAALCGKNKAILLLVDDSNTSNYAVTKSSKSKIAHGYVFGGELAVGKKSWNALVNSTK